MPWFKRTDKGILTPTEAKREVPDGLWFKSPAGKIVHTRELKNNAYVVPEEDFHVRIGSAEYFEILFDLNEFTEMDADMESGDPLKFVDTKPYPKRIKESQAKSDLKDAVRNRSCVKNLNPVSDDFPFGRRPHDGSRVLAYADGQNVRQTRPAR